MATTRFVAIHPPCNRPSRAIAHLAVITPRGRGLFDQSGRTPTLG